ncbi:MAG: hypothetical protein WBM32_06170 [Crocosphaera sp.]
MTHLALKRSLDKSIPKQEFGLDVIAMVRALRYQEHRSIPQIHEHLQSHNISISDRSRKKSLQLKIK